MIVVDSNILAYFFIEGKKTALARQIREKDPQWVAPTLWQHEFLNILVTNCLFAKLPLSEADMIWSNAEEMMRGNEYASNMRRVLPLAVDRSATSYDTEYALLAESLGVQCVTEDVPLQKAFPGTAVPMAVFLKHDENPGVVRESRATYRTRKRR